jgi:hypothetical protein
MPSRIDGKKHTIFCKVCRKKTPRTSTYQKYCPDCRKEQYKRRQAEYLQRTGGKRIKQQKRANWLRRYNITPDEFDMMYQDQEGCCAICLRHQSELEGTLCVDHCHRTGEVRGLLCNGCNLLLGRFENKQAEILSYLGLGAKG